MVDVIDRKKWRKKWLYLISLVSIEQPEETTGGRGGSCKSISRATVAAN